jgi:uncharacterized membrane-anchored protein YitT (DUF2179 family)
MDWFVWVIVSIVIIVSSIAIYLFAAKDAKKQTAAYTAYLLFAGICCGVGLALTFLVH